MVHIQQILNVKPDLYYLSVDQLNKILDSISAIDAMHKELLSPFSSRTCLLIMWTCQRDCQLAMRKKGLASPLDTDRHVRFETVHVR